MTKIEIERVEENTIEVESYTPQLDTLLRAIGWNVKYVDDREVMSTCEMCRTPLFVDGEYYTDPEVSVYMCRSCAEGLKEEYEKEANDAKEERTDDLG